MLSISQPTPKHNAFPRWPVAPFWTDSQRLGHLPPRSPLADVGYGSHRWKRQDGGAR